MSKMMQPRDQMSDLMEKEKLRVSGAIQDFWQGSVGRIKVEDPLSAVLPGEKEQDRASPSTTTPPLVVLKEGRLYPRCAFNSQSSCLHLPVLRLQACPAGLRYTVPISVVFCKGSGQEPLQSPSLDGMKRASLGNEAPVLTDLNLHQGSLSIWAAVCLAV